MTAESYVSCLYSDDDYAEFLIDSCILFIKDLITEEELKRRKAAVAAQIAKQ